MRRIGITSFFLLTIVLGPAAALADHDPAHDTRENPNCAFDARRSADANGDGEPDHMTTAVSHDTSFPRQVVVILNDNGVPIEQIPPFFGGNDGPDQVTVYTQGDHRMLGANPAHQPGDGPGENPGEPEQLHNGAIYASVDYDEVEHGQTPTATAGAGIYEADHLVMACWSTDQDPDAAQVAVCPAGNDVYRKNVEKCPDEYAQD